VPLSKGVSSHRPRSGAFYEKARGLFPGGVNSPVRAFKAVGGAPVFMNGGQGAYLTDVDGNRYLDFCMSWGPLIFGHADPDIVAAIVAAASSGTTFGASTPREVELGERLRDAVPSLERMRFVSSGTEATMSALRLARGFTGRPKIVKVHGGYHGHADGLLASAGSGVLTLGLPDSAGVTAGAVADTLLVPFNDIAAMEATFDAEGNRGQIAAVIVEPIPGNMGLVIPRPAYLPRLRSLCSQHGTLLIFDEVITGFRVGRGGAQGLYGVTPDLTCLGKIVGGGLPMGVYGGRSDIMAHVAPEGPVYQAGTLSGNPIAAAAGIATLKKLDEETYRTLDALGDLLQRGIEKSIRQTNAKVRVQRVGSAFTIFFTDVEVTELTSAKNADTEKYGRFFNGMLDRGFYLPPAQLEAAFISTAHTAEDIGAFVAATRDVFATLT